MRPAARGLGRATGPMPSMAIALGKLFSCQRCLQFWLHPLITADFMESK